MEKAYVLKLMERTLDKHFVCFWLNPYVEQFNVKELDILTYTQNGGDAIAWRTLPYFIFHKGPEKKVNCQCKRYYGVERHG